MPVQTEPHFGGETYDQERDQERLGRQLGAVRAIMADHQWRTPSQLARMVTAATTHPCSTPSISARLRDLRKPRFGGHVVERRYLHHGIWQYRVAPPERETNGA